MVSLNSIMVDGTGMCGGCRVEVGGQTRFTCVDGPEFDGHLVDWDLLLSRQKIYVTARRLFACDRVRQQRRCKTDESTRRNRSQDARARCPSRPREVRDPQFQRSAAGLHAGAGAGRGRALPAVQEAAVRRGLPGAASTFPASSA